MESTDSFLEKIINSFKGFLIRFHRWQESKWLLVSLISTCASIWYAFILAYCGNFWGLKHLIEVNGVSQTRLTIPGYIISFLTIFWSFLTLCAERYYKTRYSDSIEDLEATNYIFSCIDSRIVSICDNKYKTLLGFIKSIEKGEVKPKPIISKPCSQLNVISSQLVECLRDLLQQNGAKIALNDLYISIIYKFNRDNEWKLAESNFPERGLSVKEVTTLNGTTFQYLLSQQNNYVFYNDKTIAKKEERYFPDDKDVKDSNGNLQGSILCYRLKCTKEGKDYITAVISITTYENKLIVSSKKDEKVILNNIIQYIIKPFENRIRIELCLAYLADLYNDERRRYKIKATTSSNRIPNK